MTSVVAEGAVTDESLREQAAALGRLLLARDARITVAESCTGGWLAKVLTDNAGSSQWFDRGFVTYSDLAKIEVLGVDRDVLGQHGAVSEAVVVEMAAGLRRYTSATVAVAVSGIAGPGGGTEQKPVGTVCFGFSVGDASLAVTRHFAGDRDAVRRQSVAFALERVTAELRS